MGTKEARETNTVQNDICQAIEQTRTVTNRQDTGRVTFDEKGKM